MFGPAVTSVFANVNLTLFVYFSSSSKLKNFVLSFEINFTICTAILSEQERAIIAFKKGVQTVVLIKIFPFCNTQISLF